MQLSNRHTELQSVALLTKDFVYERVAQKFSRVIVVDIVLDIMLQEIYVEKRLVVEF